MLNLEQLIVAIPEVLISDNIWRQNIKFIKIYKKIHKRNIIRIC
jgi:hypothetical protein